MQLVERWSVWETARNGPSEGNPFLEQAITARFKSAHEDKRIEGFYDGEGIYRIRFMPSFEGRYQWELQTSWGVLESGAFEVMPPSANNHGGVYTTSGYHFSYQDGTPYLPLGTTCYAWAYQSSETKRLTVETIQDSCFNKLRFCLLPKHYNFNFADPRCFPFEGRPCSNAGMDETNFEQYKPDNPDNQWDFTRFQPEYFRQIESCVCELLALGIQADLILFHPYDRWGFSQMNEEQDQHYLRYTIARLSAYRNIWWSLANEYDLMEKDSARWERLAETVVKHDPYQRLRSIHNCFQMYDHSRPWITHASIQRQEVYKCAEFTDAYRMRYRKPIVIDENGYEGNLPLVWGNISGQEMVRRFWETTLRGGYATHGETLLSDDGLLWWSHGGVLHGESEPRLRFLQEIIAALPYPYLKPAQLHIEELCAAPDRDIGESEFYLLYYGISRPSWRDFQMERGVKYNVTVFDTWRMTKEDRGVYEGNFRVMLPGHEYMSILLKRI